MLKTITKGETYLGVPPYVMLEALVSALEAAGKENERLVNWGKDYMMEMNAIKGELTAERAGYHYATSRAQECEARAFAAEASNAKLREALNWYGILGNYLEGGWQGDPEPSPVNKDQGKCARAALSEAQQKGEKT